MSILSSPHYPETAEQSKERKSREDDAIRQLGTQLNISRGRGVIGAIENWRKRHLG